METLYKKHFTESNKLKTGGMAQVVGHLPRKCKPLSSYPSTAKKRGKSEKLKEKREVLLVGSSSKISLGINTQETSNICYRS
jgi:hypothetical protein